MSVRTRVRAVLAYGYIELNPSLFLCPGYNCLLISKYTTLFFDKVLRFMHAEAQPLQSPIILTNRQCHSTMSCSGYALKASLVIVSLEVCTLVQ
jgi:hypothetical protein